MVIEVTFKGNRREFFEWPFPEAPTAKTAVIVEAERGEDLGRVHATGDLAIQRKNGTTHGKASPNPLRKVVRAASGDEIAKADHLRDDEKNVRTRAIEKVRALGLDMKVSDTEWQWDRKRLTVYFTAEQRVDFRALVRQLEGLFGTRVHMWHIGVRDEAKRVDGVGRCGRQLCSASWLPELVPVKSSTAKDQHLSTLNPAQISGACGRLMCCLRYEHEFYVQQRKRFPKEGKIIRTAQGEEKVISLDIFRETVTLRSPAGDARVVPLAQVKSEIAAAAGTADVQAVEPDVADEVVHEHHDELIDAEEHREHTHTMAAPTELPSEVEIARPAQDRGQQRQQQRQQRPQEQRPQQQRPQQHRPQQQRPPQQRPPQEPRPPRPQQPPRPPQPPEASQEGGAQPTGDAQRAEREGGRRRRRGRRGGRRGRGGPPGGSVGGQPPGDGAPSGPE